MSALPLQLVDSFLLQYNVGQALFAGFVLASLAALPLKSRKVMAIHFVGFGLIFMLTPQSLLQDIYWKFLGLALLVVGPMVYVAGRQ